MSLSTIPTNCFFSSPDTHLSPIYAKEYLKPCFDKKEIKFLKKGELAELENFIYINAHRFACPEEFINLKKAETPKALSHYKIQIFKLSANQIALYISQRNKKQKNNCPSPEVKGTNKCFNGAVCIKLTLKDGYVQTAKVSKIARLTFCYDQYIPEKQRIKKWNHEISYLYDFKKEHNICQIKNHAQYIGKHCKQPMEKIVMYQKLYDQDLFTFLKLRYQSSAEPLTSQETYNILKKILTGLEKIHAKEIIHNDIKLENIFMDKSEPYIGDFECSIDENCLNKIFEGTLLTFSPEKYCIATQGPLLQNETLKSSIGTSLDMWSLGCILTAMKTGFLPSWIYLIELKFFLGSLIKLSKPKENLQLQRVKEKIKELQGESKTFYLTYNNAITYLENFKKFISHEGFTQSVADHENIQKLKNYESFFLNDSQKFNELTVWLQDYSKIPGISIKELDTLREYEEIINAFTLSSLYPIFLELYDLLDKKIIEVWRELDIQNHQEPETDEFHEILLKKLFEIDPRKRITAKEALKLLEKEARSLNFNSDSLLEPVKKL